MLDASANPFLQSTGAVIEAALAVSFALSAPIDHPKRFQLSGRQHGAVLDSIARGDPAGASRAMSACILQGAKGAAIHRARAHSVDVTIKLFGR